MRSWLEQKKVILERDKHEAEFSEYSQQNKWYQTILNANCLMKWLTKITS